MNRGTQPRMPANGSASSRRVANGASGNGDSGNGLMRCVFPQAPAKRVYCMPAQFSRINGQVYQNLTNAYGNSTVAGH